MRLPGCVTLCLLGLVATLPAARAQSVCLQTGIALLGDPAPLTETETAAYSARASWNPDRNEYFVVWSTYVDDMHHLFGQRIGADGSHLGPNLLLTSDPNAIIEPTIAAAAGHDEYMVAWQTQSKPFNGARGMVLDGDGGSLGDVFVISERGEEPELIHVAATDRFVFSSRASAQLLDLDGNRVGDLLALTDTGAPAPNGGLAANAAGQVLSLWRNQVDTRLEGRRIAPAGDIVGDVTTYSNVYPASGRAAYLDYRAAAGDYVALYSSFERDAVDWLAVAADGSGSKIHNIINGKELQAIAAANEHVTGSTLFLWSDDSGAVPGLFGQLLSSAGQLIDEPELLPVMPGYGFQLAPARARGEALLFWSNDTGLLAQRLAYGCTLSDAIFADGFD